MQNKFIVKDVKYHLSFDLSLKRNSYKGCLIAMEGIDGSGKTTQVKFLKEYLVKAGRKVFMTKNPTDGKIGLLIREVLSGRVSLSHQALQYLFVADRCIQQEQIISHLKDGDIVITDRYFWSTIPYTLVDKKQVDLKNTSEVLLIAYSVLSFYHQFIMPDFTFWLRASLDRALERLTHKPVDGKELYETKIYLNKASLGYEWLYKKFGQEFVMIDGDKSADQVAESIKEKLDKKI